MKKCLFCGKLDESMELNEQGILLCDNCKAQSTKLKEEFEMENANNVIELDPKDVEIEEDEQEVSDIKCEIVLGVKEDGSLYFTVGGNDTNLLIIDGLVKFGQRRMEQIWEQRDLDLARAQEAARAEEPTAE